jgi:hypothetical protein
MPLSDTADLVLYYAYPSRAGTALRFMEELTGLIGLRSSIFRRATRRRRNS